MNITQVNLDDLSEILQLQYLAYQSEADLFGSRDIPPLKQTLDEVIAEYNDGIILKMCDDSGKIIGSIRAKENAGTVYIGKLMVHPDYRHNGYGTQLLQEIECRFPQRAGAGILRPAGRRSAACSAGRAARWCSWWR